MKERKFRILKEVVVEKNGRSRTMFDVECTDCKLRSLMSKENTETAHKILHACKQPVRNKWLMVAWV